MNRLITIITLLLVFKMCFTQELAEEHQEIVQTFVDCIKSNDTSKLKTLVVYPLSREYPLSDITNELEFTNRYNELFDDNLKSIITSSDIKNDWAAVGWRGIMLNNGVLWIDYDGKLISVNYQSEFERNKRSKLIEMDILSIHESLDEFEEPVLILETKRFRVRIDKLNNRKYRYASWSINSSMSEKPDLILNNGDWIPDGTGGNHKYKFVNGNYTYDCVINVLRANEMPPAQLIVYKNDKEILNEPGQVIRK